MARHGEGLIFPQVPADFGLRCPTAAIGALTRLSEREESGDREEDDALFLRPSLLSEPICTALVPSR